jgi:AraC-like DNA-binding protein
MKLSFQAKIVADCWEGKMAMVEHYSSASDTFRVGPLVNLAPLVQSLGYEPEPIFKRFGFELNDFENPDHRLPYSPAVGLIAECATVTHCAHFGVLLGERTDLSLLGIAGFLVRSAPTVQEALDSLIENLDLQEDTGSVDLHRYENYVSMVYTVHVAYLSGIEYVYDLGAVIMSKVIQTVCGSNIPITVKLIRPAPLDLKPYRRSLGASLFFNSTECSVTFPRQCLELAPPSADKWLFRHLKQEALNMHERYRHDMVDQLPVVLRKGLLLGTTKAGDIADEFGVSERTLHRRLQAHGTTYRQELDRARQSVSKELLSTTNLPIYDLAQTLGYSDSSGFIRAFQRWSGTSPSSWRKQNSQTGKSR